MTRSIFAVLALFAGAAAAQGTPRPDPADPKAARPKTEYRSPFADYKPYAEPELASWRKANEEMEWLGGHKGHVPAKGLGDSAPKPPAGGHGGHK